jgi:hypothetical protein
VETNLKVSELVDTEEPRQLLAGMAAALTAERLADLHSRAAPETRERYMRVTGANLGMLVKVTAKAWQTLTAFQARVRQAVDQLSESPETELADTWGKTQSLLAADEGADEKLGELRAVLRAVSELVAAHPPHPQRGR